MSQYLNFFIRRNDSFIFIADYSRSTKVYEETHAPYGKIRKFDTQELRDIAARLQEDIAFYEKQNDYAHQKLEAILRANNSIEEKLDIIDSVYDYIEENDNEIKIIGRYAAEINFTANISEECPIYAGIEINDPTEKDIVDY